MGHMFASSKVHGVKGTYVGNSVYYNHPLLWILHPHFLIPLPLSTWYYCYSGASHISSTRVKLLEDRWPHFPLCAWIAWSLAIRRPSRFFVFTQMRKSLLTVVQFNCWAKELQIFYSPRCPRINPTSYLSLIVHFTLHNILCSLFAFPHSTFHWNPTR